MGTVTQARLKAPRAGAVAGIVFSILMLTSLVLTRLYVPSNPVESGRWLQTSAPAVKGTLVPRDA